MERAKGRSFRMPQRRKSTEDADVSEEEEEEDIEDAVSGSFIVPVSPTARQSRTKQTDGRKQSFGSFLAGKSMTPKNFNDKKKFSMTTLSMEAAHQVGLFEQVEKKVV